jgi:hypothetical protein
MSARSSLPVYFLCEAELSLRGCDRGQVPILASFESASGPQLEVRGKAAVAASLSTDGSLNLYILTACATGGWRGGRRAAMPLLPALVRAAGAQGKDLRPVRGVLDHHVAQNRGALLSAARPALSFVPATQEENPCSHES